jgi:hypothetical protein
VLDTVNIYTIPGRSRKLSLRFLTWFLLKKDIQTKEHDSIEDARHAYLLYKRFLEFEADGRFDDVMDDIFAEGHKTGFKPRSENDDARPDTPATGGTTGTNTPGRGTPLSTSSMHGHGHTYAHAPLAQAVQQAQHQLQHQNQHSSHQHQHHAHQQQQPPHHGQQHAHAPRRGKNAGTGHWTPPTFAPSGRRW